MKLCWCCNGKRFFMRSCSLCEQGIDHYQCLKDINPPKRMECQACSATAAPKSQPNDSTTGKVST